jgi:hypothetical protein
MKQRNGINIWTTFDGKTTKSETCPGEGWHPAYSPRRVRFDTYTPYLNAGEWGRRANAAMAAKARANFEAR